jgi:ABC-type multidrug transport system ATPase subunit
MKSHVLEIDSVQKSINHKTILYDVYLKCKTGDVIGILGRNGSGKSTLLRIIYDDIEADFKRVCIDGKIKNFNYQIIQDVSFLNQDSFIPKKMFVKQSIIYSVDREKYLQFISDDLIERIIGRRVSDLSGGELRYLEIKLLLENNSKFLLMDEPFKGLSPVMIAKVMELINVNAKNKGIIITDHSYINIIKLSTQIFLMKLGALYKIDDKNELVTHGYLNSNMLLSI